MGNAMSGLIIDKIKGVLDEFEDVAIGLDLPFNTNNGSLFELTFLSIDQAVANLKIVQITDVLFFLEIIYFSASTFAFAYRDNGFKWLFSS